MTFLGFFKRTTVAAAAFVMATGFSDLEKAFAPDSDLWAVWQKHDASSTRDIDHGLWTTFLEKYVLPDPSGVNRIAYLEVDEADRRALQGYIDILQQIPISQYNRPQQEAYWINLYNAATVSVILDHYPVKSIRDIDISPGLFADGPWGKELLVVEGEEVSLNDIEHRILRPIWNDPRVHYAVNCASIGCPNLAPVAFTADALEVMKNEAARAYVNHPRGVTISGSEAIISKIYLWFSEDFGDTEDAIKAHLLLYADDALAAALKQVSSFDYEYDWGLNDGSDQDAVAALNHKSKKGRPSDIPD